MGRAVSPALSENEVDISKSLFQDGDSDTVTSYDDVKDRPGPAEPVFGVDDQSDDDDEAFITIAQATAYRKKDKSTSKNSGAFQSMGLNPNLTKAIIRKGFAVPTPIQRKTIPLILDGQDVVGMARTGSGKTAAFVIPMMEKLRTHSAKVGARAIILSPSRELALQTLKVVKEFGRGTDLRTTLLVGGDSLEEQFANMASNPDIIIATPGRFEHLKVEMGLDLSSVKYVVFDEADRLFEMGFASQLREIMHSLPPTRQTLLFSATLPKSLVEFARAGLQDPKLIRLDAETKIAPGLQSAFFTVKRAEKEGALLHVLSDLIMMPTGPTEAQLKLKDESKGANKKRKRGVNDSESAGTPSRHSTIVFAATKHHVEYLAGFLKAMGFATSYVYGSLDQTARKLQVQDFRNGMTNILVVTDVAARGLDIPILANVINYDFPSQPKIYIHRVGRTARAGKDGWSYSLIAENDMAYLLDLQLFLSRKLIIGSARAEADMFKDSVVVGTFVRDALERHVEGAAKVLDADEDLLMMRDVASKGEKQYLRTRNAASMESVKRAKTLTQDEALHGPNLLFENDVDAEAERRRRDMLAKVSGFKPSETIFEIGRKGAASSETADIIKRRRSTMERNQKKMKLADEQAKEIPSEKRPISTDSALSPDVSDSEEELVLTQPHGSLREALEDEVDIDFATPTDLSTSPSHPKARGSWRDSEHFMSYTPTTLNMAEDRGYGVHSGGTNASSHFVNAARDATMDLANDESKGFKEASKPGMRWDKRHKKFVSRVNDEDGSKGKKMIRGESGQKIAASFRSGRFDAWRKANKMDHVPKVGELERVQSSWNNHGAHGQSSMSSKRFKHRQEKAPKDADKYRDDYFIRKKRVDAAREKRVGRFADGAGKNELRGVDDVRKVRKLKESRRAKNARPSRKGA